MDTDDLKKAARESPDGKIRTSANAVREMPSLIDIGSLLVGVRDDIAMATGVETPENVKLIAVQVVYLITQEKIGNHAKFSALAVREQLDPEYCHLLQEL